MTQALSRTYNGHLVDLLDFKPYPDIVTDLAHHLGMIPRFNGAVRRFYSVAEHSVNVSILMGGSLAGLLHEAGEAFVQDINGNLKRSGRLGDYGAIENEIHGRILDYLGVSPESYAEADRKMLELEGDALIKGWNGNAVYMKKASLSCLMPDAAEQLFLDAWKKLKK